MNQCIRCRSYAINHHSHGRDGSDKDLCDVCYWRKRAEAVLSAPPVGEPVAHTALKQIQQHLRTTSYHPVKDRIFEIVDQYFDGAPSAPAGEKR